MGHLAKNHFRRDTALLPKNLSWHIGPYATSKFFARALSGLETDVLRGTPWQTSPR